MALTFSSARSRSVICFASVAMQEASLLEALAEPTPGTRDAPHAKRRGGDGRQGWGGWLLRKQRIRLDRRRRRERGWGERLRARGAGAKGMPSEPPGSGLSRRQPRGGLSGARRSRTERSESESPARSPETRQTHLRLNHP